MKYLKIFIIISFLMFSVSAAAEFYKYVDEEGNVLWGTESEILNTMVRQD